jgi:hypothetical protein
MVSSTDTAASSAPTNGTTSVEAMMRARWGMEKRMDGRDCPPSRDAKGASLIYRHHCRPMFHQTWAAAQCSVFQRRPPQQRHMQRTDPLSSSGTRPGLSRALVANRPRPRALASAFHRPPALLSSPPTVHPIARHDHASSLHIEKAPAIRHALEPDLQPSYQQRHVERTGPLGHEEVEVLALGLVPSRLGWPRSLRRRADGAWSSIRKRAI